MGMYEAKQCKEKVSRRIGQQTRKVCLQLVRNRNNVLQLTTAKGSITVNLKTGNAIKSIEQDGKSSNGTDYNKEEILLKDKFNKCYKSMKVSDIANKDGWPNEIKKSKSGNYLESERNPYFCAEPHSIIKCLANINIPSNITKDGITGIKCDVTDIKGDDQNSMTPCAVCKQWLTSYGKGYGSGDLKEEFKLSLIEIALEREREREREGERKVNLSYSFRRTKLKSNSVGELRKKIIEAVQGTEIIVNGKHMNICISYTAKMQDSWNNIKGRFQDLLFATETMK